MCLTSISSIRELIYSNSPKNMNNIHKDSKDLVSVTISLGKSISQGGKVLYYGLKQTKLGGKDHVLIHLHGRKKYGSI